MKTALYLRVSTDQQSTDSQRLDLENYCVSRKWTDLVYYHDQISGAKASRQGLDALRSAVRAGKVSRVLVFRLDRLGRSLSHLALLVEELNQHNVALIVPGQGIDTSADSPAGRLQLNILGAIAEFERGIIRERVNAGLQAAKARGVRLGRPGVEPETIEEVKERRTAGESLRQIAHGLGIGLATVQRICAVNK